MPCTEKERARRRERYERNIVVEREQARMRAQRRRQNSDVPLEVIRARKERNLEVQAAYRRENRLLLKMKAWRYRSDKKFKKKLEVERASNGATSKESEEGGELDA